MIMNIRDSHFHSFIIITKGDAGNSFIIILIIILINSGHVCVCA